MLPLPYVDTVCDQHKSSTRRGGTVRLTPIHTTANDPRFLWSAPNGRGPGTIGETVGRVAYP
jgi:hypothetical protein